MVFAFSTKLIDQVLMDTPTLVQIYDVCSIAPYRSNNAQRVEFLKNGVGQLKNRVGYPKNGVGHLKNGLGYLTTGVWLCEQMGLVI